MNGKPSLPETRESGSLPAPAPAIPDTSGANTQALPLVDIPGINEHIRNDSYSNLAAVYSTDQHLPIAQHQLAEIYQSPRLTASPRPFTPLASVQELASGETRPRDRSTLHKESHLQDTLVDNSFSDNKDEHSSLFRSNNTATLTSLSGESSKSQPTRHQDGIPISLPITPNKKTLSEPGLQRVCLTGRAELPSYAGPNASVANSSECYELNPCPLSPGEVRSPIRGTIRKRQAMDDFPDKMRIHYRRQWDELCAKPRSERGTIDGYESDDSELEFSEWEDAKQRRRKEKKL